MMIFSRWSIRSTGSIDKLVFGISFFREHLIDVQLVWQYAQQMQKLLIMQVDVEVHFFNNIYFSINLGIFANPTNMYNSQWYVYNHYQSLWYRRKVMTWRTTAVSSIAYWVHWLWWCHVCTWVLFTSQYMYLYQFHHLFYGISMSFSCRRTVMVLANNHVYTLVFFY